MLVYAETESVHEDRADTERMDFQEGDVHETLGGWTEVEMNAPRDFQPKVKKYTSLTAGTVVTCRQVAAFWSFGNNIPLLWLQLWGNGCTPSEFLCDSAIFKDVLLKPGLCFITEFSLPFQMEYTSISHYCSSRSCTGGYLAVHSAA